MCMEMRDFFLHCDSLRGMQWNLRNSPKLGIWFPWGKRDDCDLEGDRGEEGKIGWLVSMATGREAELSITQRVRLLEGKV